MRNQREILNRKQSESLLQRIWSILRLQLCRESSSVCITLHEERGLTQYLRNEGMRQLPRQQLLSGQFAQITLEQSRDSMNIVKRSRANQIDISLEIESIPQRANDVRRAAQSEDSFFRDGVVLREKLETAVDDGGELDVGGEGRCENCFAEGNAETDATRWRRRRWRCRRLLCCSYYFDQSRTW